MRAKSIAVILAGFIALLGLTVAAWAADQPAPPSTALQPGQNGPGMHRGMGGMRPGMGMRQGPGARMNAEQGKGMQRPGMPPGPQAGPEGEAREGLFAGILDTPEGKAELDRFQKERQTLGAGRKAIFDAIQTDVKGGKTQADAFQAHAADFQALVKKELLARIQHQENLLAIAKTHVDDLVKKTTEQFGKRVQERKARLEKFRERRAERQGQGRPIPPAPPAPPAPETETIPPDIK